MVGSRSGVPSSSSWLGAGTTRVDFDGKVPSVSEKMVGEGKENLSEKKCVSDAELGFEERAFSAAGAAIISAIIVNPLDVAKTRLQAQAAGVPSKGLCHMSSFDLNAMLPDLRSYTSCTRSVFDNEPACPPECGRYKGTLDVFYKIIRQEGFSRLWRGTNASLALAVPTVGIYLPCYDILRNVMDDYTTEHMPSLTSYVPLLAGSAARSLACISCYPVELARTRMQAFKEMKTVQNLLESGRHCLRSLTLSEARTAFKIYKHSAFCGLVLEHNSHVMSLFLQSAGQLLSRSGRKSLNWLERNPVQPLSLGQIFLLVLWPEQLQLLQLVHWMWQRQGGRLRKIRQGH